MGFKGWKGLWRLIRKGWRLYNGNGGELGRVNGHPNLIILINKLVLIIKHLPFKGANYICEKLTHIRKVRDRTIIQALPHKCVFIVSRVAVPLRVDFVFGRIHLLLVLNRLQKKVFLFPCENIHHRYYNYKPSDVIAHNSVHLTPKLINLMIGTD